MDDFLIPLLPVLSIYTAVIPFHVCSAGLCRRFKSILEGRFAHVKTHIAQTAAGKDPSSLPLDILWKATLIASIPLATAALAFASYVLLCACWDIKILAYVIFAFVWSFGSVPLLRFLEVPVFRPATEFLDREDKARARTFTKFQLFGFAGGLLIVFAMGAGATHPSRLCDAGDLRIGLYLLGGLTAVGVLRMFVVQEIGISRFAHENKVWLRKITDATTLLYGMYYSAMVAVACVATEMLLAYCHNADSKAAGLLSTLLTVFCPMLAAVGSVGIRFIFEDRENRK